MKNLKLFLILFFTIPSAVFGAHYDFDQIQSSSNFGTAFFVQENMFANLPSTVGYTNVSVDNYVQMSVDWANTGYHTPYAYTFEIDISSTDKNLVKTTETKYLSVAYDPSADPGNQYGDRSVFFFKDGHKLEVTVKSVYDDLNGTSASLVGLPSNIHLQSHIGIDRIHDFNENQTLCVSTALAVDLNSNGTVDELQLTWPIVAGAESYEVEWTYVDDYAADFTQIASGNITYDFKSNSSRVIVSDQAVNSYSISLIYDRGYIVYRVRPVGLSQIDNNHRIFAHWSMPDKATGFGGTPCTNNYYYSTGYSDAINWQYSMSFAENGKKKEVVNFYDGALKSRQIVTAISSIGKAVIGESIYDYQGRKAIDILPVPVQTPALEYYENFNMSGAGGANRKYNWEDFDKNSGSVCNTIINPLSTVSGASQYYSPSNPDQSNENAFIPDANQYPMAQVEYTPDNTGRVRRQGGVGSTHQLGGDPWLDKSTKYFYSQPVQVELDRLFGSEVGNAAHYKKNMVVDPNGQVSISYLDLSGRTIATALSGAKPENVEAVDNAVPVSRIDGDLFAKDDNGVSSMNKPNASFNAIEFRTTFSTSTSGLHNFTYSATPQDFFDGCMEGEFCYDCLYDLSIKISDDCGILIYEYSQPLGPTTLDINCQSETINVPNWSVNLTQGSYSIVKTLTVNKDAYDYHLNEYLDTNNNLCFNSRYHFELLEQTYLDYSGCEVDCEECVGSLGSLDEYVALNKGTKEEWEEEYENCIAGCTGVSLCENVISILRLDVSPGGQYGLFSVDGGVDPNNFPLSVFNVNNNLPKTSANWKNPVDLQGSAVNYEGLDGSDSKIYMYYDVYGNLKPLSGNVQYDVDQKPYSLPQDLLNIEDFIANWKTTWAEALVYYHPEYCYSDWCTQNSLKTAEQNGLTSDEFDILILNQDNFQEATTAGLTNSLLTHLVDMDPFFKLNPGQITTDMMTLLSNFHDTYNAMEFAAITNKCVSEYDLGVIGSGSCESWPTSPTDPSANEIWQTYASYYYSSKQIIQKEAADDWVITNNMFGYNECIGNEHFNVLESNYFKGTNGGANPFSGLLDPNQACSKINYEYYRSKIARFDIKASSLKTDDNNNSYNRSYYAKACPIALDVEMFINDMIAQDELLSLVPSTLSDNGGFTPAIVNQIQGSTLASSSYNWTASISGNVLTGIIANNTYTATLTLTLASTSWADVVRVGGIENASGGAFGTSNFNLTAYLYDLGTLTSSEQAISGNITIDINDGCTFTDDCKPTDYARSIGELLGALAFKGEIASISPVDLEMDYGVFLTRFIRNELTQPYNDLRYLYNAVSNTGTIYQNGSISNKIEISFPGPVTLAAGGIIKEVRTDQTKVQNGLVLEYETNLGVTGTMDIVLSTGDASICYDPTKLVCNDIRYDVTRDFASLLEHLVESQPTTDVNLSENNKFTALLASYLGRGEVIFAAPVLQNKGNEWVGRIDVKDISTGNVISSCEVKLYRELYSDYTAALPLDQITDIGQFWVDMSNLERGEAHNFTVLAVFNNDPTFAEKIYGRISCLPLFNCSDCIEREYVGGGDCNMDVEYTRYVQEMTSSGHAGSILARQYFQFPCDCIENYLDYVKMFNLNQTSPTVLKPSSPDMNNLPLFRIDDFSYSFQCTLDFLDCPIPTPTSQHTTSANTQVLAFNAMYSGIFPPLPLVHTLPLQSGDNCECQANYMVYLDYWTGNYGAVVPSMPFNTIKTQPVSYDEFLDEMGCEVPNCLENYKFYRDATVDAGETPVDYTDDIADCNCFKDFTLAGLNSQAHTTEDINAWCYMNKLTEVSEYVDVNFDQPLPMFSKEYAPNEAITNVARSFSKCTPASFDIFEIEETETCSTWLNNLAKQNAELKYQAQVRKYTKQFHDGYMAKCMSTVEDMTIDMPSQDYHFTLYYYDQAGNLTRTVPPAGVVVETDPSAFIEINKDRTNNTRNYMTGHKLATVYEYNSLNQLVRQHVPDNDPMNKWTVKEGNGLVTGFVATDVEFSDANNGILVGTLVGTENVHTYIYKTSNGGATWTRDNPLDADDIRAMDMIDNNRGYAAGDNGLFLKTKDGGENWKIIKTNLSVDIIDLAVFKTGSTNHGAFVGAANQAYYFVDNGASVIFTLVDYNAISGDYTSVEYENSALYAIKIDATTNKPILLEGTESGGIFTWVDQDLDENTVMSDLNDAWYMTSGSGILVGKNGVILKSSSNGEEFEQVANNLIEDIVQVYFKDANTGIALTADGILHKTIDGGSTWAAYSSSGFYTSFSMHNTTTGLGYAVGNGSIFASMDISKSYVDRILGNPIVGEDFTAVHFDDSQNGLVGTGSGKVYKTEVISNTVFYYDLSASALADVKKILLIGANGMVIDINGELKSFNITGTASSGYSASYTVLGGNAVDLDVGNTIDVLDASSGVTSYNVTTFASMGLDPISTIGNYTFIARQQFGPYLVGGIDGAIARSTGSWLDVSSNVSPVAINDISSNGTKKLLAGTNGRLYQSTGSGAYKLIPVESRSDLIDASLTASGNDGYAISDNKELIHTDGITSSIEILPSSAQSMTAANTNDVYIALEDAIMLVSNGGQLWSNSKPLEENHAVYTMFEQNGNIYAGGEATNIAIANSNVWSDKFTTCDPIFDIDIKDQYGVMGGLDGLSFHSTTSGTSWEINPYAPATINGVLVKAEDDAYFLGESSMARSAHIDYTNSSAISGLSSASYTSAKVNDKGVELVVASDGLFYKSPSISWAQIISDNDLKDVSIHRGQAYAVGANKKVYVVSDITTTAIPSTVLDAHNLSSGGIISLPATDFNKVVQLGEEYSYVVGSNGTIIKTIDGGEHWFQKPSDINQTSTSSTIQAIAMIGREDLVIAGDVAFASHINDQSDFTTSMFYYDRLGRMVVSQNAKQYEYTTRAYSYTLYDEIGRITEVGEKANNDEVENTYVYGQIDDNLLQAWITSGANNTRTEITRTYYDVQVIAPIAEITQINLRKRVASMSYEAEYDGSDDTYDAATHYTYDIHGNVDHLVQDIPELSGVDQRYKHIYYEYELVSGNVNKVLYNPGAMDAYYHKYAYDADNRITDVYTSLENQIWDRDAHYKYYAHGPLARTELGDLNVQGQDFAYTIHGWLKGVNSSTLYRDRDMGRDGDQTLGGNPYANFGGDVYGYSLGYYESGNTDYSSITTFGTSTNFLAAVAGSDFLSQRNDLYNGNIGYMVTAIPDQTVYGSTKAITQASRAGAFMYDQLNRLAHSLSFDNLDDVTNQWGFGSGLSTAYSTDYTYDPMGNITNLQRYDATQLMDDLSYHYDNSGGATSLNSNRLYHVNDVVGQVGTGDLDDQGTFDNADIYNNNYAYDELGNLIQDKTERIAEIKWTVYGKIQEIIRETSGATHEKSDLEFKYDASGNRILKIVKPRDVSGNLKPSTDWIKTYYVRDASGNIMATYSVDQNDATWEEAHIYGSSRLGVYKPELVLKEDGPCTVNFDAMMLYTSGLGFPEFMDGINNALINSGLSSVMLSLSPSIAQQVDFARIEAPSIIEFEAYLEGLKNFLCTFNCYTIVDDVTFQTQILPYVDQEMLENTHMPKMDINQVSSINNYWALAISNLESHLTTHYGPCVPYDATVSTRKLGAKHYELSNHLGNVLVTVTDKKVAIPDGTNTFIAYYNAEITTISDYYPFGMIMDNRSETFTTKGYRFGFNGKEGDNEV
ncbi:MAG: hypothetical protein COA58_09865, partial [Bacteroidetes bacterium]